MHACHRRHVGVSSGLGRYRILFGLGEGADAWRPAPPGESGRFGRWGTGVAPALEAGDEHRHPLAVTRVLRVNIQEIALLERMAIRM